MEMKGWGWGVSLDIIYIIIVGGVSLFSEPIVLGEK
jgi:hypothetical protein